MKPENKKASKKRLDKKPTNLKKDVARFLAIGAQIAGTLAAGVLIGHWLDQYLSNEKPVMTLILGLLFSFAAIYQFYKVMNN